MTLELDKRQPELIDALLSLAGIALTCNLEALALPMLDAVRKFRPDSPRLDSFDGWFCLRRGDMTGAVRHLSKAVENLPDEAGSTRALLATVLCAQGDAAWQTHAEIVIAKNEDPGSVYLMKAMRGDVDVSPTAVADTEQTPAALTLAATPENVAPVAPEQAIPAADNARSGRFLKG